MEKNLTNNDQESKRLTEKFMLELELRYREVNNGDDHYRTPKIVIGIYDSWDEAEKEGNAVINNCLANHFIIRDKFVKNYVFWYAERPYLQYQRRRKAVRVLCNPKTKNDHRCRNFRYRCYCKV